MKYTVLPSFVSHLGPQRTFRHHTSLFLTALFKPYLLSILQDETRVSNRTNLYHEDWRNHLPINLTKRCSDSSSSTITNYSARIMEAMSAHFSSRNAVMQCYYLLKEFHSQKSVLPQNSSNFPITEFSFIFCVTVYNFHLDVNLLYMLSNILITSNAKSDFVKNFTVYKTT